MKTGRLDVIHGDTQIGQKAKKFPVIKNQSTDNHSYPQSDLKLGLVDLTLIPGRELIEIRFVVFENCRGYQELRETETCPVEEGAIINNRCDEKLRKFSDKFRGAKTAHGKTLDGPEFGTAKGAKIGVDIRNELGDDISFRRLAHVPAIRPERVFVAVGKDNNYWPNDSHFPGSFEIGGNKLGVIAFVASAQPV